MIINRYIERTLNQMADGSLSVEEANIKVTAHMARSEEDSEAFSETNEGGYLEAVLKGEIDPQAGVEGLGMWKASLADAKELDDDDGFSPADEYGN